MDYIEELAWGLFESSGEISYYLLYKDLQNSRELEKDEGMSL